MKCEWLHVKQVVGFSREKLIMSLRGQDILTFISCQAQN